MEPIRNNELGSSIARRSTAGLHEIVSTTFESVCESEIDDDDISMAVEKEVFEFEVAMDNFLLVDVPYTRDELGKQLGSILFFEVALC